jgi:hypothetical protein
MVMPSMFVMTRWQSKFKMLWSLFQNKGIVRSMSASQDEECKSLHDKDLTDDEWHAIEVRDHFLFEYIP